MNEYTKDMLAKLNELSIGDTLTGCITETAGRLYWGIARLTQVQFELILTRPSYTQFDEFIPNWSANETYTITQLTGAISAAGIAESVFAATVRTYTGV